LITACPGLVVGNGIGFSQTDNRNPIQRNALAHEITLNVLCATLAKVSEADIFDENRFAWRNGSALGNVIAGNTFGHYEEHLGWIRAGLARAGKG